MHFTIINLIGLVSPLVLAATLREIWKEGRSRSVMMRMLPPERRPVWHRPESSSGMRASAAERKRHDRPLWTLRDCQMELLTQGVIHAFDASATSYQPHRLASTYPPGRVPPRVGLHRAKADHTDHPSILQRTLQRNTEMLSMADAARYRGKPEIDDGPVETLTYASMARPAHGQGTA